MFYRIVIWKDNDDKLYWKKIKGYYCEYYIGKKNQFGHEVQLIIDIKEFVDVKIPLRIRFLDTLIRILDKIR